MNCEYGNETLDSTDWSQIVSWETISCSRSVGLCSWPHLWW